MEQIFDLKSVGSWRAKKCFMNYSALKVKKLIDHSTCDEACEYFLENESRIIEDYSGDARGLSLDTSNGKKFIKYFQHPLRENASIYGKFVNSGVFNIASNLLEAPVFLRSLEVHSRCALGTVIPPHQDNAYFGLQKGRGLTFYIPITNEYASAGGLKYYKNPNNLDLEHKACSSSGFSLTISEPSQLNHETFEPDYEPGDCTIHHSKSIHFADDVPSDAERGLVVRMSLFAEGESKKKNHEIWYKEMVRRNRELNKGTGD